ncbi:mechanosensitive ion channel family protein [Pigmentiphaga aceris]|uniref:Mechanosensitive ion channel family protein n=1 Tax=Pigmentiphaga aceris TaxID=1940612 RepID=A0A5C0AZA7_9BURK|nr:mechanosensitive ion channel domain-containing protein [Pigmentiphaga aceris]QEI07792.1 mechanosensitive ion channel family protein [Pigmentiphaga aceris]
MLDLSQFSPTVATGIAALIGIVVALIAFRIGGLLLLRATRGMPVVHTMVLACHGPARLALPLFALQLVWQAAPNQVHFIESIRHLNGLALIGALTWLAINVINGLTDGVIARHPADVDDNLQARRIQTQARVLARTATLTALVAGLAIMLMTFPGARQVGASLLASAGVIGLIAGIAAKPVFSNLIAGLQIALAQPIRIDDVLIVQGEWGRVEEITGTYVVLKIWDDRRLIIPLQWFIENPFQNWTRTGSQLLGSVFLNVDFAMPIAPLRSELERLVPTLPEWDGRFFNLQVTDATERTMQLRILVTAGSSSKAFDLRCKVREAMIDFMQREYPQYLPTLRVYESNTAQPEPLQPIKHEGGRGPLPARMDQMPDGPGASAEIGMAEVSSAPDR